MKKFNTILAVAAVALTSVFGFASCEQDDDFDYMPAKTTTLAQDTIRGTRGEIKAPQDPKDPFRGGITYHMGDKVTKNLSYYGDAEFVCISNSAPYYFIHVSKNDYSMSEKDKLHYSSSPYAVSVSMLNEIGEQLIKWNMEKLGEGQRYYYEEDCCQIHWKKDVVKKVANELTSIIPNAKYLIDDMDDICYFDYWTEEFWVNENHDYPYASLYVNMVGDIIDGQNRSNTFTRDSYHWSYASPCLGHHMIYCAKVNN